jgi:hypothetical protein
MSVNNFSYVREEFFLPMPSDDVLPIANFFPSRTFYSSPPRPSYISPIPCTYHRRRATEASYVIAADSVDRVVGVQMMT